MSIAHAKQQGLPYIDPADMPARYALPGYGTCMAPQIEDGALLIGDKEVAPQPGDIVIVHFRREHAARYGVPGWIKRLALRLPPRGMSGLIVVEQANPPRRFTVPTSHVAAVHRCIGTGERLPDGGCRLIPFD